MRRLKEHRAALGFFGTVIGVTLLGALAVYWVNRRGDQPEARVPAAEKGEKTLEEVRAEFAEKARTARSSNESGWVLHGEFEKLTTPYLELKKAGRKKSEQRVQLLNHFVRGLADRAFWKAGVTEDKLHELFLFARAIVQDSETEPRERLITLKVMAQLGRQVASKKGPIEDVLQKIHADFPTTPVRAEVIQALATMRSPKVIEYARRAAKNGDHALARSVAYSLAEYVTQERLEGKNKSAQAALDVMNELARRSDPSRSVAVKLLARAGDRRIASVVKQMLQKGAKEYDIESAAYAAGELRLTELRPLLRARAADAGSLSGPSVSSALQKLGEHE